MRAVRWGDNDRYFGPFTWHPGDYKRFSIILSSRGDDDVESGQCYLRLSFWRYTLCVALPNIIRPYRTKVSANWDAETVARLGRDWYWDINRREYGFSYSDGFLQIKYGRSTHNSSTDCSKGYFVPWTQWRHVRRSFYGLQGEHLYDEPQRVPWEERQMLEGTVPTVQFSFRDYDGEELTATTKIEEREWRFGTGYFRWLSLFRSKKIRRSLDITFSGETGKEKGSWKGGTIGTGIDMLPGELHEEAFKRYCEQDHRSKSGRYKIQFVGKVP